MMNGDKSSIGRRRVLSLISILSSTLAAPAIAGKMARAQTILGPGKKSEPLERDPVLILARARNELGLTDSDPRREGTSGVGGMLKDGMTSYDHIEQELVGLVREIVKSLMVTERYQHAERVKMKVIMLNAEKEMKATLGRLSRGETTTTDARRAIRSTLSDYLSRLEALPQ